MKKRYYYYMRASFMIGPFELTKSNLEKRTLKATGVYLLADQSSIANENRKVVKYVGRAIVLSGRLDDYLGRYDFFYYIPRVTELTAFWKECREFHRYGKARHLNNKIHPARPAGKNVPACTEWRCNGEAN